MARKVFGNSTDFTDKATLAGTERICINDAGTIKSCEIDDIQTMVTTGDVSFDTDTLHVDTTNNRVGIGTTNPGYKLDITGAVNANGTTITSDSIEVNALGAGDRNAFIDLHSDDTNTDFGMRLIKKSGVNGEGELAHKGTGKFNFSSPEGANWVFNNGNVGIGTTNPGSKLSVVGAENDAGGIEIIKSDGSKGLNIWHGTTANIVDILGQELRFRYSTTNRLIIKSSTINLPGLPTSATGLSSGDIWRDGTDLKIVA